MSNQLLSGNTENVNHNGEFLTKWDNLLEESIDIPNRNIPIKGRNNKANYPLHSQSIEKLYSVRGKTAAMIYM